MGNQNVLGLVLPQPTQVSKVVLIIWTETIPWVMDLFFPLIPEYVFKSSGRR